MRPRCLAILVGRETARLVQGPSDCPQCDRASGEAASTSSTGSRVQILRATHAARAHRRTEVTYMRAVHSQQEVASGAEDEPTAFVRAQPCRRGRHLRVQGQPSRLRRGVELCGLARCSTKHGSSVPAVRPDRRPLPAISRRPATVGSVALPKLSSCDRGANNPGVFRPTAAAKGYSIRPAGPEAPEQLGRGER